MSKLPKLPASSALDPSSMSFGPPRLGPGGGLGTWGRGSGNKKLSVQETAPLKQVNRWGTFILYLDCHSLLHRFAGLLDDDGDAAPLPPASVYHGRASEPAFRSGGGKQQQYNGARSGVV